jgi:hypothetical protein
MRRFQRHAERICGAQTLENIRTFNLRTDWETMEYSCEENNKDFFEGHIEAMANPSEPTSSFKK